MIALVGWSGDSNYADVVDTCYGLLFLIYVPVARVEAPALGVFTVGAPMSETACFMYL